MERHCPPPAVESLLRNRARTAARDNRIIALSRQMHDEHQIARAVGCSSRVVRRALERTGNAFADRRTVSTRRLSGAAYLETISENPL